MIMKTKTAAMKLRHIILCAALTVVAACGETDDPKEETQYLTVSTASLSFEGEGGSEDIVFKTNGRWSTTVAGGWISVSPGAGTGLDGDQTITVTAKSNDGEARTGTVTIIAAGQSKEVPVSQKAGYNDGIKKVTISEFKALKDDSSTWYRLSAEIISISSETYGDLYVCDNTGQLYVYGLAPAAGGNNTDFPSLGLKAGDVVTFVAHRKTYNGIDETDGAYYEKHTAGTYPGSSSSATKAGWLELPETSSSDDGTVFLSHLDGKNRNYSIYFDKSARVARWTCYPYVNKQGGQGRNNDPYAFDPLVSSDFQANLQKSYQNRTIDNCEYVRGHMTPSNDRAGRANYDVFLSTNIMPQSSTLNAGPWSSLELSIHNTWSKSCDTVYVVAGTYFDKAKQARYVTDISNKEVRVPDALYKAVLAHTTDGAYHALGAYFDNGLTTETEFKKSMAISIDELEKKVGVDLFVNLPDDVEKTVEAEDPATTSLWW